MNQLKQVRVIRYVREECLGSSSYYNMGGVTLLFDLDYETRKVDVRFSICSAEDNFSKKLGIEFADAQKPETFDLDAFRKKADEFGGFTDFYLQHTKTKLNLSRREEKLLEMVTL